MDEGKWERWGALAGVVFVVLVVVGAVIGGSPPKPSDSASKIVNFYKDNQDSLKIGSYLAGIGLLPFLWFLGTLFGRLRKAEGGAGRVSGIALTAAVVALAIATVGNGINAYTALHPEGGVGGLQLSSVLFAFAGFAIAAFVAATSVVVLRSKFLPAWFGYAGAALSVAWLVGAAGVSTESDAIFTVGFIVFFVWAVWIVALSVLLYRAPQPQT